MAVPAAHTVQAVKVEAGEAVQSRRREATDAWNLEDTEELVSGVEKHGAAGPARCCPPHHPTQFKPSFLEINGIL